MRAIVALLLLALVPCAAVLAAKATEQREPPATPDNAQIDYGAFLRSAGEVQQFRAKRRVSEAEFLRLAAQKDTLILDTRSKWAYDQAHVDGAVHLNFSDITKESLHRVLGEDKNRRVLIYCNNNFRTSKVALAGKMASAALNIPTFITLYEYGYRNLYELGPVVDPEASRLNLVGTQMP